MNTSPSQQAVEKQEDAQRKPAETSQAPKKESLLKKLEHIVTSEAQQAAEAGVKGKK